MVDLPHFLFHGVCHQLPERTLVVGGCVLPACARCSGVYLGALAMGAALALRGRLRCVEVGPRWVLFAVVGIWVAVGIDVATGLLPHPPPLANPRRLISGLLLGLTLPLMLTPAVNALAQRPRALHEPPLSRSSDLALPALLAGLAVLPLSLSGPLPAAVGWLSVGGLLVIASQLNFALLGALRSMCSRLPRSGWALIALASALSVAELTGMAWLRAALE